MIVMALGGAVKLSLSNSHVDANVIALRLVQAMIKHCKFGLIQFRNWETIFAIVLATHIPVTKV